jgi:hypothetical protein
MGMASKYDAVSDEVLARYQEGMPVKEIMRLFAMPQDAVYRQVDQAGLPRRGEETIRAGPQ